LAAFKKGVGVNLVTHLLNTQELSESRTPVLAIEISSNLWGSVKETNPNSLLRGMQTPVISAVRQRAQGVSRGGLNAVTS